MLKYTVEIDIFVLHCRRVKLAFSMVLSKML
jgi:hypothetical protein